jgi:hypothetical protein
MHPWLESLILTHILQSDYVKQPLRLVAIADYFTIPSVGIGLSASLQKMWVRIRLESTGLSEPITVISRQSGNYQGKYMIEWVSLPIYTLMKALRCIKKIGGSLC